MRTIRIAIGMTLILAGMALGIFVTLYYFAEGLLFIKAGLLRQGLIFLLLWSELLGIVTTLALVIPGVLMLRNLHPSEGRVRRPTTAAVRSET